MTTVHIYTVTKHPATRFRVPDFHGWVRNAKRRLLWCRSCERQRWAQNLVVQAYYDDVRFYCRSGHGCAK